MEFIEKVIESTQSKSLLKELSKIDIDSLKVCKDESHDGDDYILGVTYRKGAWVTDPDSRIVYKRLYPNYFNFLMSWFNI